MVGHSSRHANQGFTIVGPRLALSAVVTGSHPRSVGPGLVLEVLSVDQKYSDKCDDTRDASEGGEKRDRMQANVEGYAADKRQQEGDSES